MPELIHKGVCVEEKRFEGIDLLEERDRFLERMKPIRKYVREQKVKMAQNKEQSEWIKNLKILVRKMNEEDKGLRASPLKELHSCAKVLKKI